MKFAYDFIAGNSRVTPLGVAAAALLAALLVHRGAPATAAVTFAGVLLATLVGSVLEKER